MQTQVMAYYDRGLPAEAKGTVTYTSSAPEVASVSEDGKITANAAGTAIIQAYFEGKQAQLELEVNQDPNGQLTVVCGTGGTIVRSAQAPYVPNQQVTLEAQPDAGYRFTNWLVDGTETTENPLTVTVGQTTKVEACFQTTGGSGGSSTTSSYTITVNQATGGKISPSTTSVRKGADKTFTIIANEGYKIADVLVDGKSVGAVSSYTFENVKAKHTITAKFEKVEEITNVGGFTDVKSNDWFAEAVQYAVDNGLMNGTSSTTFSPKGATTRGMIVTILYRQAGSPEVESDGATWWSDARAWAMANGVSDGTNMDKEITREQLATMLYRYAELMGEDVSKTTSLGSFKDGSKVSAYAVDALEWAAAEGIVTGKTGNVIDPQAGATRAETATMFMRFCEISK